MYEKATVKGKVTKDDCSRDMARGALSSQRNPTGQSLHRLDRLSKETILFMQMGFKIREEGLGI